jgi:serine/threonine-protein kinase RsbW
MRPSATELQLVLPARPENVLVVRQAVAGLGEAVGLPEPRLADLKTVVTEACNNVVLHAYDHHEGPLEVTAAGGGDAVEVEIRDRGTGFRPRAEGSGATLGLGLPLIASLSDRFEISGGAGEGTRTRARLSFVAPEVPAIENGAEPAMHDETAIAIEAGAAVRPVLSRVIGALAARAEFSLDRLADTVLLGDAVSSHGSEDFSDGQVGISIQDGQGTLRVRVGPLVEGAGERFLEGMEIPGDRGSLRKLAQSMRVTRGEGPDEGSAEYLEIEVSR